MTGSEESLTSGGSAGESKQKSNIFNPSKRRLALSLKLIIGVGLILYSILLVAGGAIWGYQSRISAINKINTLKKLGNPNDPMYANLNGFIEGQITKVEGSQAFVKSTKGGTGIFAIGDQVIVTELNKGKLTEIGTTKEDIRLNETGSIRIKATDTGYLVTAITYIKLNPEDLKVNSIASNSAEQKIKK